MSIKTILILLLTTTICFSQIAEDKQKHFVFGGLIGGIANEQTFLFTGNKKKSFWIGLGVSLLSGVLKETYDKSKGGKFDFADIGYTVAGGLVGSLTINIFNK